MKNFEQFVEDLKADEDLRSKLAAEGNDEAAANAILAEAGYDVTVADIKEYAEKIDNAEPSDEDLRKVAGGASTTDVLSYFANAAIGGGSKCWN